jgi:hypothetical protein
MRGVLQKLTVFASVVYFRNLFYHFIPDLGQDHIVITAGDHGQLVDTATTVIAVALKETEREMERISQFGNIMA